MKKIALNLLKSADEKLRSIGSKPQPPQPQPHLQRHSQQQQQQAAPPPVPAREPIMAERRVQMRQGRRERRRDGDGDSDPKRRSRSEGPSARRVAQSMDVGSANNNHNNSANRKSTHSQGNASFERREAGGGVRKGRGSPTGSDDGGLANPDPSGTDSDSDSERVQWTKNPLLVRKLKKSKAEKRNSGADQTKNYKQLGQRNTNRESWVYLAPEGTPLPASPDQQRPEESSNSGSLKSKYQKLEEMRKKRIDIAVTSDEENTPESRISRLRQRALQGALGNSARTDNSRAVSSDHNSWGASGARVVPTVMSDQGSRQPFRPYSKQAVPAQPQAYRMATPSQPANRLPQQLVRQGATPRQPGMMVPAQPVTPHRKFGQETAHQPPAPMRQSYVRPFTDSRPTEPAFSPAMAARQQFYTIPEPHLGTRAVHNSSPEIHARRFNPAVRVPSADSIYDSVAYAQDQEAARHAANRSVLSGQRTFAQANPPTMDVMEIKRGTALQYQTPANQRNKGVSQFNEVVELRLKSARVIDRPLSQSFQDSPSANQQDDGGFRSEDSLDELIESNIQYLEREINQVAPKKSAVSRSSSLPDPRKTAATASRPQVTVSGQHSARSSAPALPQTQSNKSELHFRVPLPPPTTSQPVPQIHIAEENQWSDSAYPGVNTYTFGVAPRVERKHSYDSRTRMSRPNSEYYDRDEVSKSDTQLNAAVVPPTYRNPKVHPGNMAGRGCVSDQNLTVEHTQGMFSDVEYDIEVSERVKKWEKFMKKPEYGSGSEGKKSVLLTPIEERTEGDRDSLMMPSEIKKSVRLTQLSHGEDSVMSGQERQMDLISLKPASSDPALHIARDAKMLSNEANLHRFFQVIQDPSAGLQVGPHLSHSTSSIYIDLPKQGPHIYSHSSTVFQPGGLMSPDELRQHMLTNQRIRSEAENEEALQPALAYDLEQTPELPDRLSRLSRYQDEIDEMQAVKHHSVSNLRRRFDEGKGVTGEEELRSDSRVAKVSPTHKDSADVSWSQMITGLEDKIRDMEVWSPNMESTQGNVVSIERVKARTLQTIPFSEDPFWKEIEEMTTFDPNSLGGHLSVSEEAIKPILSHAVEESPHSSTLPTQPRQHSALSMKERMQRSKSLYTPNITPLTINVQPYSEAKTSSLERGGGTDKYSGPNALDEVLEDIRTSLERKPLSPKRKTGESSDSHRSSPGPAFSSELMMRGVPDRARPATVKPDPWDMTSSYSGHMGQPLSVSMSSSSKPAPPAAVMPGMTTGHYRLDANLLKQKLLSTGLVEDDKPEPPVRSRVPASSLASSSSISLSKPVAVAPPQSLARSVVTPTQRTAPAAVRPPHQQDKLSQVNNSMEELRQLAVNVERKIGVIKSRLLTADDQNLDRILLALRKITPSTEPLSPDPQTSNMQDFYHRKKSKLEDALDELNRIYSNLDINNDALVGNTASRDYHPTGPPRPAGSSINITPVASVGTILNTPPRVKTSSAYISPLPVATVQAETSPYQSQRPTAKSETDKQCQSEFDMISKSFQAIIDEVNKTASLVSSASTPQPRARKPLPEIKELQSKVYATREHDIQKHTASPETQRRPLNITVSSQQSQELAAPTPKSPPAIAPKPSLRAQSSSGLPQQVPSSSTLSQPAARTVSIVTSSIQSPLSSVVRADIMAKPAPEKREPRVRGRFRPKHASQEKDELSRRARSKSSPTISFQDLPDSPESGAVSSEGQTTAKSQLSFQIEPVGKDVKVKPPLHLDVVKAQQGAMVELKLKPPAMFQDGDDKESQANVQVVAQPTVLKPSVACAPPLDSKTVTFPGSPTSVTMAPLTVTACVAQAVSRPPKTDASSSESSAEGRDKKGAQRMGRGVAMMVELFSSSDEERLRRSHPLHTRSAPDLSADIASDDSAGVPKAASNLRTAEMTKLLQQKADTAVSQGSPIGERKRVNCGQSPAANAQNDALSSPQSPSNKPPFHPFKRQQRSPDRASESSPQRNVSTTETQAAPKDSANSVGSASVATTSTCKIIQRPRRSSAKENDDVNDEDKPERPRSFHELLASFEPDLQHLNKLRLQGRCASADVIPEETVVTRVFRSSSSFTSEPDLRAPRDTAPTPQEVRQWKL